MPPQECYVLCSTMMSSITANYGQYGYNNIKINEPSEYLLCDKQSLFATEESYNQIVSLRYPQIFRKSSMYIDQSGLYENIYSKEPF